MDFDTACGFVDAKRHLDDIDAHFHALRESLACLPGVGAEVAQCEVRFALSHLRKVRIALAPEMGRAEEVVRSVEGAEAIGVVVKGEAC